MMSSAGLRKDLVECLIQNETHSDTHTEHDNRFIKQ